MKCRFVGFRHFFTSAVSVAVLSALNAFAQPQQASPPSGPRQFHRGSINRVEDVPAGRFRNQLDRLRPQAKYRAAAWLHNFHFTELDLATLHTDPDGAIYYVDAFTLPASAEAANSEPVTAAATVPVTPFPSGLIFHSKPGAPNTIYLNFVGMTVTGTAWNSSEKRTSFQAVAFSMDADFTTFSDAEQTAIRRIWQRVAEDYAPFDVDVTTEKPAVFTERTAMALITRSTDATGAKNPSSTGGGVAYINVFGGSNFGYYRPAWIYYDNLANTESYIAEAATHEIGHNMGLSHDGTTGGGGEYYGGHGSGETSWGPIMGTGYNRNVSQWSRGEYYLANNTQDDLALIAAKLTYISDDHGDSSDNATALTFSGGTNIVSTTPETDPTNSNPANKGVIERNTDVDVFSFDTGEGTVRLTVKPWVVASGTRGGNLDVALELRDASNNVIATNNPSTQTGAQIQTAVPSGTYYLFVRNSAAGNPLSSTPTGYTSYGSIGQYFISGFIVAPQSVQPLVQLTVTANNPEWGSVSPSGGTYELGTQVQVTATPASYYQFAHWTNGASGENATTTVLLSSNTTVQAIFQETLTTNSPTPLWWLAANGFGSNPESAVNQRGANGMFVWQSYVAGLDPNNPSDQLKLALHHGTTGDVLSWNTVAGRVYSIRAGSDIAGEMTPLPGAEDLPATTQSFTNSSSTPGTRFYRLEVKKL